MNFSFPENQSDALLLEVQDIKKAIQGRATIPIASLTDNPVCIISAYSDNWAFARYGMSHDLIVQTMQNDRIRWWPIYHDDQECVGKVQLFIGSTITCDDTAHIKVSFSHWTQFSEAN